MEKQDRASGKFKKIRFGFKERNGWRSIQRKEYDFRWDSVAFGW